MRNQPLGSWLDKERLVALGATCFFVVGVLHAQQPAVVTSRLASASARPCRVVGHVLSGGFPLPGVAITAFAGERSSAVTASDVDGSFVVPLVPGSYRLQFELTGFVPSERQFVVGNPPCEQTAEVSLVLVAKAPASMLAAAPKPTTSVPTLAPSPVPAVADAGLRGRGGFDRAGGGGFGAGRQGGQQPPRFQALTLQQATNEEVEAAADPDALVIDRTNDPAARLLPAGFSLDAPIESVTVNGTRVEIDRGQIEDRLQALARGDFGLADALFGPGGLGGPAGQAAAGLFGGPGPFGAGGDGGGRGGGRGDAIAALAGRIGGANRIQTQVNYTLGGSMFDTAPYPLRNQAQSQPDYTQQTAGFTVGGALKIPGLYNGSRTTFNVNYSGNRNGSAFDQYATVPDEAFRRGDFSSVPGDIINPQTGQPFPNNQVPVSAASQVLLGFIPTPNLPGDTRNFHNTGITHSNNDQFTLRITHSFTQPQQGRGGRGGGRGQFNQQGGGNAQQGRGVRGQQAPAGPQAGAATTNATSTPATSTPPNPGAQGAAAAEPQNTTGGNGRQTPAQPGTAAGRQGGGQGNAGRGGRGNVQQPLSVTMNASVTYRHNRGDRFNVFPALNATTKGSTLSVPVSVTARKGRVTNSFSVNVNQTRSDTLTPFAFNDNVAARVGINGVSTDPFDWGVPTVSFGNFTGLRSTSPSRREDRSWQVGYNWLRPSGLHNYRAGATLQWSRNITQSDTNPNGSFTFTGLYASGGSQSVKGSGLDFADFLLGLPQQATRQYSASSNGITLPIEIHGAQYSAFLQDDWRVRPRWTINWGVQYDYIAPFTEANGHMVNLDVAPGFVAVAPVESGESGPFSGTFPVGLVYADTNNIAPRVGVAWRNTNRSAVRGGYGLIYNTGSYSSIARQLYQQPPFFSTGTAIGTPAAPLSLTDPFATISPASITNNYGIDKNYEVGLIHQWTVDYSRDLLRSWNAGVTYVGTLGRNLDLLRAPNRGPSGLRIDGVEPFTWQSSDGASHASAVSVRLQKRQTKGIAGSVSYTLSKSMDDTTATSGNPTVAQDDQNLAAEWARSNFDQRHQINGQVSWQLPWGVNRQWLNAGGRLAAILGSWNLNTNVTWTSGTPLTVRCSTCASDVARGTGGTLRANYNGQPVDLDDASLDQFFNTSAFSVPGAGTFGNSLRNMIIGPGSHQVNATFSRDVQLGSARGLTIQVNANNLLNTVNYAAIDTNVNSQTFGQVLGVRGMRTARVNLRIRF